jgi:chromosome segregation ATPase
MISKVIKHIATMSLVLSATIATSQETAQPTQHAPGPPVSYSSVSQLNALLSQIEQAAQMTTVDLAKMRIERWKTDSGTKRQTQANVESVERNLQNALPEIINQLRASPEDLTATFKLYRNLDALYDVLGSMVESAGAFGSKDEFQSLSNDLTALERSRRSLAERLENLTASKEAELNRLRAQVKAQAPATTAPRKVVVDDTEPPKKPPAKKKPKTTKPATTPATQPQPPSPPQPH